MSNEKIAIPECVSEIVGSAKESLDDAARSFTRFYREHSRAMEFLFSEPFEEQRLTFFDAITAEKCTAFLKHHLSDPLIKILDAKPKTEKGKKKRLIDIYEHFSVQDLISLYEYYSPKETRSIPTSSSLTQINKVISNVAFGKTPQDMQVALSDDGKSLLFLYESRNGKDKTYIEFKDSNVVMMLSEAKPSRGRSKNSKYRDLRKFLIFLLMLINDHNFESPIIFDASIMVYEYKMYTRTLKAKEKAIEFLHMIKYGFDITVYTKRGKKEKTSAAENKSGFISGYTAKEGSSLIEIELDPNFDMSPLFEYFTILPKWAFSLDSNPFALIQYIFERARAEYSDQKRIDPKVKKYTFTISIEQIRQNLGLPEPSKAAKNDNFNKIRLPIQTAIEKLEDAIKENHDQCIQLEPYVHGELIEDASTKRFLSDGYLKVGLSGNYFDYFKERKDKAEVIQEKLRKKHEKREELRMKALAEAEAAKRMSENT